jgi:hypothetical protein
MTKRDCFSPAPRRDDITNFHLPLVDNDPIDEQFHQLSPLGKGELRQRGAQTLCQGCNPLGQRHGIDLWLHMGLSLAQLQRETLSCLR